MERKSDTYNALNKAWKSTCRVLFGQEAGELSPYQEWLASKVPKLVRAASSLTGKEVVYAITDYSEGSKRASLDEVWKLEKFPPLSINDIKDMDSLVEAVQDRVYYTGNVILGNSSRIEGSSNCSDSHFILDSGIISDSKYLSNCGRMKKCEYAFGSDGLGESKFIIGGFEGYRNMRCLEVWKSQNCSDCFYINGLANCSNCMFCFNVQNKRHAIGNLEISREKYMQLKQKLLSELIGILSKERSLPSLVEIAGECKSEGYSGIRRELEALEKIEKPDLSKIEAAFENTSKLLFGKALVGVDNYAAWLKSHVLKMETAKSIISGKPMLLPDYSNYLLYPRHRLVTLLEAEFMGDRLRLEVSELEGLSFQSAPKLLSKVAYLSPELMAGENRNVVQCSTSYSSMDSYRSPGVSFSKNTAYSFWPRTADCVFGSSMAFESSFCINCYNSEYLNRCFEVDSSKSCSDAYFMHNCENVRDSMFCFNAKNLTNAIGNAALAPEQYKKIKYSLVSQIADELEKKKSLKYDIYDIGPGKR